MKHLESIYRCMGALAWAAGLAPCALALDAGGIAVHGAISATASYSDEYNYLGQTTDTLDLNLVEVTLNGNYRFESGLRFGAQIYAYELQDFHHLTLDFASFDYQFHETLGVRLGRTKQAWGLYGEEQDVDQVRPFAFLPLDHYSKPARPIDAAVDGVSLYGTLGLGRAGSLDYKAFGGWMVSFDPQHPYFRATNEALPVKNTGQEGDKLWGMWVAWNTPLDGFRVGASYVTYLEIVSTGAVKSAAELAWAPSDLRLSPRKLPAGVWDTLLSGKPGTVNTSAMMTAIFAEYQRGDWVFALEGLNFDLDTEVVLPRVGASQLPRRAQKLYGMITWQATSRLQLGTYYAESFANRNDRGGDSYLAVPKHRAWQKDFATAAGFAVTEWITVKAEAHLMNGTKLVLAEGNGDAAKWTPDWTYFVLKTTISF